MRRIYRRIAPSYDLFMRVYDALVVRGGREWVGSRARGRVLEIGIGTGLNLAHYPRDSELTGIDLSPEMLDLARRRAGQLGRHVELSIGDAASLRFADTSFDTVVFTFALSTIPDDRRAVAEARRVLVPGGRLLVLDHGQGRGGITRALQRLSAFFTSRLYADERLREPLEHVLAEGLIVEEVEHASGGWIERVSARKPV